jgi:hypothetical protein
VAERRAIAHSLGGGLGSLSLGAMYRPRMDGLKPAR